MSHFVTLVVTDGPPDELAGSGRTVLEDTLVDCHI